jgi:hypothetical protein
MYSMKAKKNDDDDDDEYGWVLGETRTMRFIYILTFFHPQSCFVVHSFPCWANQIPNILN